MSGRAGLSRLARCGVMGGVVLITAGVSALPTPARGQRSATRTDSLRSQMLGVVKRFMVYLPPSYGNQPARRYPVAYYLHGHSGDESNWVRNGALDRTLDSLIAGGMPELIVVMPDGDDGWYTTWNALNNPACERDTARREPAATYCVPWPKYDDYIARDLVARIDSTYRTRPDRAHRAIAGLSMGGYGAVALALNYPDVFSAAASHSGVLSPLYEGPHPFSRPPRYASDAASLRMVAGGLWPSLALAFGRDSAGWRARDPARLAQRYSARHREPMPALFVDVGTEDPYADQSRDFHASLERLGIAHAYVEWPGRHNWVYWRAHAAASLAWIASRIGR